MFETFKRGSVGSASRWGLSSRPPTLAPLPSDPGDATGHPRRHARHSREDATRMSGVSDDFPVQLATWLYLIGRPAVCCGVVLPVCPCVVSFSKFHDARHARSTREDHRSILVRHVRHARFRRDMLATSSRGWHEETASVEFKLDPQRRGSPDFWGGRCPQRGTAPRGLSKNHHHTPSSSSSSTPGPGTGGTRRLCALWRTVPHRPAGARYNPDDIIPRLPFRSFLDSPRVHVAFRSPPPRRGLSRAKVVADNLMLIRRRGRMKNSRAVNASDNLSLITHASTSWSVKSSQVKFIDNFEAKVAR